MPAPLSLDALKAAISEGSIDTVLVAFPDMQGRLIGKRFLANFFVEGALQETHGCNYLLTADMEMEPVPGYAAASWAKGYGDFVFKPDLGTLMRATWLEGTAIVLADLVDPDAKTPVRHSPRAILRQQLDRLEAMGLTANFASELEFYLFEDSYRDAFDKGYRDLKTAAYYIEDYHIFQTTKEEDVMRTIRNELDASGIPVENSKGEWGPGQEEINVRYADALTMADRHVIMKNGIKEIAFAKGKAISFMAKWNTELAGSSAHIHMSLADSDGQNAFFDPKTDHTMSILMRQFLAGQLAYAGDLTYFLAPYINSYKRFQIGTFAPTKAVWSFDNRTAGYRVVGAGTKGVRVECRTGGADLNPYLAFAALIAAGLKGIEEELELEPAHVGDAYEAMDLREIPKTLRDAIVALEGSEMLRAALGDDVVGHYVHTARWEQSEHDRHVTDWELKRGFERT